MTNAPLKISIVTPSYNQGEYLENTLNSVLDQDYPNLEYVVIDGGSQDESPAIIEKYQQRLHYSVSEADNGHGDALNKGFRQTSGEIMGWLNSDDMYTPWSLKVVSEIFTRFPHVDWIVGCNSWWNANGEMLRARQKPMNIYDYLLGNYRWIQQESVFWRRRLWEDSGACINEDYRFMVDGELWTRFFPHAPLHILDCVVGGYRQHTENRAHLNKQACIDEIENAISMMRKHCSKDVQKNYTLLRLLKPLSYSKDFNSALSKLVFSRDRFGFASYPNITWEGGKWVEKKIPYSYKR